MNTDELRIFLIQLVDEHPKSYARILSTRYVDILDRLDDVRGSTIAERVYNYVYPEKSSNCRTCGNPTSFDTFQTGYRPSCSKKCNSEFLRNRNEDVRHCKVCQSEFITTKQSTQRMCSRKCTDEYQRSDEAISRSRQKRIATLQSKYNVTHNSELKSVREKKRQTEMIRYGRAGYTNPEKCRQTRLDRYGTVSYYNESKYKDTISRRYNASSFSETETFRKSKYKQLLRRIEQQEPVVIPLFTFDEYTGQHWTFKYKFRCSTCQTEFNHDVYAGKLIRCTTCFPRSMSGESALESEIVEFLQCHYDGDIQTRDRTLLNGKELDIYIQEKRLAVELNGVYWHTELNGNKDKYYHLRKTETCLQHDVQLIHIYDTEWIEKRSIVESLLLSKLGLVQRRLYARHCKVVELTSVESNEFLGENHLQGKDTAKIRLGLTHNNELVAVMTFSTARYDTSVQFEMVRFCNKLHTTVVGGASKLLKHFIELYSPTSIVSYADRRYSSGHLYKTLGFEYHSTTSAKYWYVDSSKVLHNRQKFQKHKLPHLLTEFNPDMTEWENMQLNGYDRIWDCGNTKWILKL